MDITKDNTDNHLDVNHNGSNEDFKTEEKLRIVNEEKEKLDMVDEESEINEDDSIMFEEAYDRSSEAIEETTNITERPR